MAPSYSETADHLVRAARARTAPPLAGHVTDPEASGHDESPLVAPRMTLRLNSAHLRRVGETGIPSWSSIHSAPSEGISATGFPINSSEEIDAAACEIAQPCPWKRRSAIRPSSSTTR